VGCRGTLISVHSAAGYKFIYLQLQHVATLASLYKLHKKDYVYPKEEIDVAWEKVLLNQYEWCMVLMIWMWYSLGCYLIPSP
jgi:hypothetical protein